MTLYCSALNQFMVNINQFVLKTKSHDTEAKKSEKGKGEDREGRGRGIGKKNNSSVQSKYMRNEGFVWVSKSEDFFNIFEKSSRTVNSQLIARS